MRLAAPLGRYSTPQTPGSYKGERREGRGKAEGEGDGGKGRGERERGVRGRAMDEFFVVLFRGPAPLISSCVETKCPVKGYR